MPYVTHRHNPQAIGDFDLRTHTITLQPGAVLAINPITQPIHNNIAGAFEMFEEQVQQGKVAGTPGRWVVRNPIANLSPSAAHVFATGTRGNGWELWILANGDPIDIYRQGNTQAGQPVGPQGSPPFPQAGPSLPTTQAGHPVGPQGALPQAAPNAGGGRLGDDDTEDQEENTQATDFPPQELPPLPPCWDGGLPPGTGGDCLCLHRFPSLPDYLRSNRHRIVALGEQVLPPWSKGYDAFQEPVMQRLCYAFPTRCISRADVVALFESWHDPVLCLVSALVWGGIQFGHLKQLLGMGEPNLRARMEALRPLVRSGALEVAYNNCSTNGRLKFNGVGPAFFTKLFYFMGQVPPVLAPAPLILDKWTSNAFRALGRQVCPSPTWDKWFDASPLNTGNPAGWRQPYPNADIYRLYVAWFNHWAQLLGTSASRLEQFVFGWNRKSGKAHWSNPRNQILKL